jgi:hypothetical protein
VRWISSSGGPLVAVPAAAAADWRGQDLASGHYELACAVEDVAVVSFTATPGAVPALVLWDEPLATAYDDEHATIVQWRYADGEADLLALAGSGAASAEWERAGSIDVPGPLLLFDAADDGAAPDPDTTLTLPFPPGRADVLVAEVQDDRTAARLVRVVPRSDG